MITWNIILRSAESDSYLQTIEATKQQMMSLTKMRRDQSARERRQGAEDLEEVEVHQALLVQMQVQRKSYRDKSECGNRGRTHPPKCPAYGINCHSCGKLNHFA